jgi:hypothetical protein
MMPTSVRTFVQVEVSTLRKSRISLIRRLLDIHTMSEIGVELATLPTDHSHPDTALEYALYALKHPIFRPEPFAESHTPPELHGHTPDLRKYDAILGVRRS